MLALNGGDVKLVVRHADNVVAVTQGLVRTSPGPDAEVSLYPRAVCAWPDMCTCTGSAQNREVIPVHHTVPHYALWCMIILTAHLPSEVNMAWSLP